MSEKVFRKGSPIYVIPHNRSNPVEFVRENLEPFDAWSTFEVTWDFGKETVAKSSRRDLARLL